MRKQLETCIRRIVEKSAGALTEDDAKALLQDVRDTFGRPDGAIDLNQALNFVENLRENPLTSATERIVLNSARKRLLGQIDLLNGIQRIEAMVDQGVDPITALNIMYRGADNQRFINPTTGETQVPDLANLGLIQLADAHVTYQRSGKMNAWITKHGIDALDEADADEFMRDLYNASRGGPGAGKFAQAAKEFVEIVDYDRILLNSKGADLQTSHGLLFNGDIDPIGLHAKGAKQEFQSLWNAGKFDPEEWEAITAQVVKSPEFSGTLQEALDADPTLKAALEAIGKQKKLRSKESRFLSLPDDLKNPVIEEAAYRLFSKDKSTIENLPMSDAKIQNMAVVKSSMDIVRQLDSRNLLAFADYDDWKAFQQKFGSIKNIGNLIDHSTRNSRLTSYVFHTSANPEGWLKALTEYIVRQEVGDIPAYDLQRLITAKEQGAPVQVMRDKGGQIIRRSEAVNIKTKEVMPEIKFDKNGQVIQRTIPYKDPLNKHLGRMTAADFEIRETTLTKDSLLKQVGDIVTSAIPKPLVADNPWHWHRILTGETYFVGSNQHFANLASAMFQLQNAMKLDWVAFAQVNDLQVAGTGSAWTTKGRRYGQWTGAAVDTAEGLRFLASAMNQLLNPLSAKGRILKDSKKAELLADIDRLGLTMAQTLRSVLTSQHFIETAEFATGSPLDRALQSMQNGIDRISGTALINRVTRLNVLQRIYAWADDAVKTRELTDLQQDTLRGAGLTLDDLEAALVDIPEWGERVLDPDRLEDPVKRARLTGFLYSEVQGTTGIVDATTRNIRTLGQDPKSLMGIAATSFMHLYSFTANFHMKTLPRIAQRQGRATAMATLVGSALIYGPVMGSIKHMLKGETPPDYWTKPVEEGWVFGDTDFWLDFVKGLTLNIALVMNTAEVLSYGISKATGRDAFAPEVGGGPAFEESIAILNGMLEGGGDLTAYTIAAVQAYAGDDTAWNKLAEEHRKSPVKIKNLQQMTKTFAPIVTALTKSPAWGLATYGIFNWWGGALVREPLWRELEAEFDTKSSIKREKRRQEQGREDFTQEIVDPLIEP